MSDEAVDFRIHVPPDLEAGTYANFLAAWHTADEFTLDFCVSLPAEPPPSEREYRLVARLKVPVTVLFDYLRTLNAEMTLYERRYGEIRKPEER